MNISNSGLELIKEFEAYKEHAYLDSAGVWTVGYGTTIIDGRKVRRGDILIKSEAEIYLTKDVQSAEDSVAKLVKVPLNQNQYDALVSFVYNIGEPNFEISTLLRKLNEMNYTGTSTEFLRWVFVTDPETGAFKRSQGLANRRSAERRLFLTILPEHLFYLLFADLKPHGFDSATPTPTKFELDTKEFKDAR